MPLSKPDARRHVHTRDIQCLGYEREDGLWDIEGSIRDSKTYSFDNIDRGGVAAGEAIHHMLVRLTIDAEMTVVAIEVSMDSVPYSLCGDITPSFQQLKGLKIGAGWRRAVMEKIGGLAGCTHVRDLLIGPVAVTAYQTIIPKRSRKQDAEGGPKRRPPVIGTCHAYDPSGSIVQRRWPQFFVDPSGHSTGDPTGDQNTGDDG